MLMLLPADFLFQNHLFQYYQSIKRIVYRSGPPVKISKNQCISVSEDCFYHMQHFIWVLIVCERICLPVSRMKRVNYNKYRHFIFCLVLFFTSKIFQLNRGRSSWVEPGLSWDKCVLLKDHNAVTPEAPTHSASVWSHFIFFVD